LSFDRLGASFRSLARSLENSELWPLPSRRSFLSCTSLAGLGWLTGLGDMLARAAEGSRGREPARSVILLWMAGGPSQLETFDPHPGKSIAGGTTAIRTANKEAQLAAGFDRLAEQMADIALIRSMVSKEGDHERGTYLMKTGYRPDPTVVHPSLGAICCHELNPGKTEIPRHISILPSQWPGRGGFLGDEYDAFKTFDPAEKVPDVESHVPKDRDRRRLDALDLVDDAFEPRRDLGKTAHRDIVDKARRMMTSEQLKAFDVKLESSKLRTAYGDTPFGRGCLAARRLIEVGVRCVEVTLDGWDTHADNHKLQGDRVAVLDPAFGTLLRDLKERKLLEHTVVICAGEFGRTPAINRVGGRDHWPRGFSIALAGGGIRGGRVIGETDPEGVQDPTSPVSVADVHATVLSAVGIDPTKVMQTPIGRTLHLSEGKPVEGLLG
jgi:hypothetical protein